MDEWEAALRVIDRGGSLGDFAEGFGISKLAAVNRAQHAVFDGVWGRLGHNKRAARRGGKWYSMVEEVFRRGKVEVVVEDLKDGVRYDGRMLTMDHAWANYPLILHELAHWTLADEWGGRSMVNYGLAWSDAVVNETKEANLERLGREYAALAAQRAMDRVFANMADDDFAARSCATSNSPSWLSNLS